MLPTPDFTTDPLMECVAVEITRIGLPPLKVYNVYRPPTRRNKLNMSPFPLDDNTIIAGDFNVHHSDWSKGAEDAGGRILRDWLMEMSGRVWNDPKVQTMRPPLVSSPDLVISSCTPETILNWRTLGSWGSDHYPVAFEAPRGYTQPRKSKSTWFSWPKADWDGMLQQLEDQSEALLMNRPASNARFAKSVSCLFRRAIHDFVPRYRQGRVYKVWWTPELSVLEREKATVQAELRVDPASPDKIEAYLDKQIEFQAAATRAKTLYWDRVAGRINRCTDISLLFQQVRKIDGRTQRFSTPPLKSSEGYTVDAGGKTELFGRHLQKVCGGNGDENPFPAPIWAPRKEPSSEEVGCGPITMEELDRAIEDLDPKTTLDPEGLCSKLLTRLGEGAKKLILELLNVSWDEGYVPDSWKKAHVVPIAKPGRDHSLPEGYRPISLTSVTSKLMESVVKNRLVFLTENPAHHQTIRPFCSRQGGFRKGRGTEEQLYSVVSTIDMHRAMLHHICLLSFDLANAFDTVDHRRLLTVMEKRGIPAKFLRWIEAFLRERKAAFLLDGELGNEFHLRDGVPQGTVLGPLLFLFHIDDLGDDLNALRARTLEAGAELTFSLFADDDGVAVVAKTPQELETHAQEVVNVVELWTARAGMQLSKLKTEGVLIQAPGELSRQHPIVVFESTMVELEIPAAQVLRRITRSTPHAVWGEGSPWLEHHGKHILSINGKSTKTQVTRAEISDALNADPKAPVVTLRVAVRLRWVEKTKLLGLWIDQDFSFVPHVQRVVDNFSLKLNFLRHLSGKSYGFSTRTLRTLYLTYVLPTFTYALGVYGPFLLTHDSPAKPQVTMLERLHRRALICVLGCRKNLNDFTAQQEAGVLPIRAIIQARIAALRERMRHRPQLWNHELGLKTTLSDAYDSIDNLSGTHLCGRETFLFNPFAPWQPCPDVVINASLPGKRDASKAEKLSRVLRQLSKLPPADCCVWTDGSVVSSDPPPATVCDPYRSEDLRPWIRRFVDRPTWGGAGIFCEIGPTVTFEEVDDQPLVARCLQTGRKTIQKSVKAGRYVCSFRTEQVAICTSLHLLQQHLPATSQPRHIVVLSDSQSLLKVLSLGSYKQKDPTNIRIWLLLCELRARGYAITLQFVYAHCGLAGNDMADSLAKAAAAELQESTTRAAATHATPPPAIQISAADVKYRHKVAHVEPCVPPFKVCADDATAPFRLAMRNQVEHRNKGGFPNAADELWCTLFEYPELALAYLQRAGVLPHYTILASSASEPELQSTQSVLDAASDISSQAEDMSDEQTVESQQPEGDLVMVAEADDWRL
ncbi:RNA-directed DNA polymerase from mobile element jockey [Diplonema papillatum]|nr:RNA-directed DNA polymerase from mobile element jockey [Diplonema papillatum]